MNILLLTYQGDIAGSTNSIYYLATGLAARGHTIVVGARQESLLYQMLEGTPVIRQPMTFGGKFDRVNMRQIKDAVQEYHIQIVNAQSSRDRYTSILARWWYNLPVALVHTRRQEPKSIGGWLQNQFYVAGTDKIIVISEQLKKTFVERGIPAKHIQVIMNGIPFGRFEQVNPLKTEALRKQYGILPTDTVIGCVARPKKQEQLIQALPYLHNNQIKVLFVGIPQGSLNHWVQKLGVKNPIIYAGTVPPSEVMHYYPLFSVYVLPSTMEGFGLAPVEAMGMGVPVVATRAQGIIDVLQNQQNGLWFEDGNAQELAQKITETLTNTTLRQYLISNGKRAAATTFSMERTLNDYEAFFSSLVAGQRQ
ncbi:MAG TPA: glycosyltransferase family 4 protein [Chitinophagales bacterium]|nr:glycosyltransferase family 4 protein [Chitinophagales bacterium]HRK29361.1 glycosyltransferase family 4 protein [Chitinophagales bacterium]